MTRRDPSTEERFAEVVLPEVEVMMRVALSRTRSTSDAEDVVQETMLRAFRAIDRFDGRHPRAWLLTICATSTSTASAASARTCFATLTLICSWRGRRMRVVPSRW
jgi:AcrR family transcriptional regulator